LFALEVGRLQNGLERLKNTQNHICDKKKGIEMSFRKGYRIGEGKQTA
jgi:hypothetical protein